MPTSSDPRLPDLFARASEMEGDTRAAWLADLRRAFDSRRLHHLTS